MGKGPAAKYGAGRADQAGTCTTEMKQRNLLSVTAPRVFSKIMQGAVKHLQQKIIKLVQFLDDILILANSLCLLKDHISMVADSLKALGFEKKCIFTPTQVIEFLGLVVQINIYLPEKKVKDIVKECRRLVRLKIVSARTLAHLIGKMTAAIPAVFPAALHY